MKEYTIPVIWQSWAKVTIKAKSLKDAMKKVRDGSLPKDGEYIDGSFELDIEGIEIHNENLSKKEKTLLSSEVIRYDLS